jgi:hypothetical protein
MMTLHFSMQATTPTKNETEAAMTIQIIRFATGLTNDVTSTNDKSHAVQKLHTAVDAVHHAITYWEKHASSDAGHCHMTECFLTTSSLRIMETNIHSLAYQKGLRLLGLGDERTNPRTFLQQLENTYRLPAVKTPRQQASRALANAWNQSSRIKLPTRLVLIQRQRILNEFSYIQSICNNSAGYIQYSTLAARVGAAAAEMPPNKTEIKEEIQGIVRQTLENKALADILHALLTGQVPEEPIAVAVCESLKYARLVCLKKQLTPNTFRDAIQNMQCMHTVASVMKNAEGEDLAALFTFASDLLSPMFVHRPHLINDVFAFLAGRKDCNQQMTSSLSQAVADMYNHAKRQSRCLEPSCRAQISWKTACSACCRFYCTEECLSQSSEHARVCANYTL